MVGHRLHSLKMIRFGSDVILLLIQRYLCLLDDQLPSIPPTLNPLLFLSLLNKHLLHHHLRRRPHHHHYQPINLNLPPLLPPPPKASLNGNSLSLSPASPIHPQSQPDPKPISLPPKPLPPPIPYTSLQELFHLAELQLTTGSDSDQLAALHLLERSLVPNPPSDQACQPELMRGVVANLKNKAGAKPATKVLLALCLGESNRHVAVEAGAVGTVIEVVAELEGAAGERALAALELMCTVAEGAAEVRTHALSVPVMVTMMGQMAGRGKEYAISVMAVIYGGGDQLVLAAPPEEVARAVALALQGDCTARGRRKGAQLLKALNEYGRVDSNEEEHEQL
ncbi:hypothetical protein Pint_12814 [Pistacia integerrima]|uniref:Uncharacterized protein n=1 Tax=Pistacia integerrima TaxID=434235 RepID=A0ACC0Y8E8_9ROSI|nr:hypothetical protein Pint_12814 [Pistacia integerrima]